MDLPQIGVSATGESAQQIERRRRLEIGPHHALRIVAAALRIEIDAVDIVAEIARQGHVALRFRVRAARLGELARHAPNLHHRLLAGEGHHDGHLQQDTEGVADVVRVEFGETFGAIAALQQEGLALRHFGKISLQRARFTGKDQRRVAGQRLRRFLERGGVFVARQMPCLEPLPAVG